MQQTTDWFSYKGRTSPYGIAGQTLGEVVDSQTAIAAAGLDWRVETVPVVGLVTEPTGVDDDGALTTETTPLVADRHRMTVRVNTDGTRSYLGVVGTGFEPLQNDAAFSVLDGLAGGGALYERAGEWNGGRRVWVGMRLPHTITVAGEDKIVPYVYAENGHDGSRSFRIATRFERITCTNALPSLMTTSASAFSAHHTIGMLDRARVTAADALRLVDVSLEAFETEAERLIATACSTDAFDRAIAQLFEHDAAENDAQRKRNAEQRDTLHALFTDAPTQTVGRGTVWGAYNAVVEYADWIAPVRGGDDESVVRARQQITGARDGIKRDALDALLAAV